ncbi:minor histocompatibility antigen H13-like [Oppia nitens]|uniref:minor histocompatibility antigen H13-like n=1 Tax=Oppia nitens TaxID=1686743 RepID=UPI0023DB14EE|nr:minor histocompatibility antigen H13-like [Oppia nitens]
MADSTVEELVNKINATIGEAVVNGTDTEKPKATTEGMLCAFASLMIMALIPIVIGAKRSVHYHLKQKESGEKPETMTSKDAAMFPFIASAALFGLYLFFKFFSKEYINLLLTGYFFLLGILALAHCLSPLVNRILPKQFPVIPYHLMFNKGAEEEEPESLIDFRFDTRDFVTVGLCSAFGVWYLLQKHWIANNIFGLAFAINGVELLHLNSVKTGCILLGGLFFYDIFWVFATDVMVTVAKSFEAPIKLIFPQDFLVNGVYGTQFSMLGLGDIVIPGIFLALLLRFDVSQRKGNVYFNTCFVAYILGTVSAMSVMVYFKHAQPVLLYLVPLCISFPLALALIKGELKTLLSYEDHPSDDKKDIIDKKSSTKVAKKAQ